MYASAREMLAARERVLFDFASYGLEEKPQATEIIGIVDDKRCSAISHLHNHCRQVTQLDW